MNLDVRGRQAAAGLHAEVDQRWRQPPPFRVPARRRHPGVVTAAVLVILVAVLISVDRSRAAPPTTVVHAAPAWSLPLPGRYAMTFTSPSRPAQSATLLVDPAIGSTQHEQLTIDGPGDGRTPAGVGASGVTVQLRGDSSYLVQLDAIDPANTIVYQPAQPVLLATDGHPGQTWTWTAPSVDGHHVLHSRIRLVRSVAVTVAGVSVPTIVFACNLTDATTGYDVAITEWFAPAQGLVVREEGTQYFASPTAKASPVGWTITLPSLSPET